MEGGLGWVVKEEGGPPLVPFLVDPGGHIERGVVLGIDSCLRAFAALLHPFLGPHCPSPR